MWRGGPNTKKGADYYWNVNKQSAHVIADIRKAFAENDWERAAQLTKKNFNSEVPYESYAEDPFRFGSFTTAGEFYVETGLSAVGMTGYRRGVVFGLLLFGLGAIFFIPGAWIGSFSAFLFCLFVIGCGLVFLETAANPYVTELGARETATSRLNLSQSFNGLGSIFATFCIGQFLFNDTQQGGNVVIPYAILGILVLAIAVVFSRVDLPEIQHQQTQEDKAKGSNIAKLFANHRMFVFGLFALLSYEVAEISINSYFINFVTGMHWMSDRTASLVLTLALAFFMVGRFLGSWIMRHIQATTMLLICAVGSVVCIGLVLCDLGIVSLVALVGNYLFEAIMFPTIFSIALTGLGNLTKSASSLLMMTPIGGCGFLLMGMIADTTHVTLPFVVPFIGFLIVLAYAVREYKLQSVISK